MLSWRSKIQDLAKYCIKKNALGLHFGTLRRVLGTISRPTHARTIVFIESQHFAFCKKSVSYSFLMSFRHPFDMTFFSLFLFLWQLWIFFNMFFCSLISKHVSGESGRLGAGGSGAQDGGDPFGDPAGSSRGALKRLA